ncbi:hypothetical protein RM549_17175 [Salegentibacter sp. F188]|uniref:DUF4374 domain-containing protein n=1 Tax=Autumnicola patrickiae TaxID=3075591 RepID=A0ABU3E7B6_9FLAO|nr:hypothetical protein [Salegentibacter sp. F188]MDT0691529.1 hypothetical protein [Salegentibacter sp. F188]
MKKQFLRFFAGAAVIGLSGLSISCSEDDTTDDIGPDPQPETGRWFTVAGAIMDETPGNGNGGTVIYSVSEEDIQDPEHEINVFENGFQVRSQRTARLQSSVDGSTMFNIAYGGDIGGQFSKYAVNGGDDFEQIDGEVNISQYAGTSPRWVKLFDGDQTGVAVSVTSPLVNEGETYEYTRGTATIVTLDMEEVLISNTNSFEIPLSEEEEAQGYYIFRLDTPVLNAAQDKLIIGTWMGKTDPATGERDTNPYERLGTKALVVDYPSLENPELITSSVGFGDNSGYRSFNSFLAEDGSIYQATQRDPNGSHILRITEDNEYDNSYVFSLDDALGVTNSYIESWRYVGNNIAYVMYTHDGAAPSGFNEGNQQSFLARVDLGSQTAEVVDLPYDPDMYFFQYQGFVVDGDNVYVTIAPVGQDGNVYIINSVTGEVTKGAQLINEPGNHFIGVF